MTSTKMQSPREKVAIYAVVSLIILVFLAGLAGYGITVQKIYDVLVLGPVRGVITSLSNAYDNLKGLLDSIKLGERLVKENQDLKNYIVTLEVRLKMLLGNYYENRELKSLLQIKNSISYKTVGCSIVFYDRLNNFFVLDAGLDKGIKKDMAVIYSYDGATPILLGKIQEVSSSTSKAMLITNPNFRVGVINASRGGIDVAFGDGALLTVHRFSITSQDSLNDIFSTVEGSDLFPPNLAVGRVINIEKISPVENKVTLEPLVDFNSIRNCLVILSYEKK